MLIFLKGECVQVQMCECVSVCVCVCVCVCVSVCLSVCLRGVMIWMKNRGKT